MRYSSSDREKFTKRIDRAVRLANIREIIHTLNIQYRERSGGDLWFRCVVPKHSHDKNPSAHISANPMNEKYGRWYCLGCETRGNIIKLVQYVRSYKFMDALKFVEQYSDSSLQSKPKYDVNRVYKFQTPNGFPVFYEFYDDEKRWPEKYLDYLYGRNITWNQIQRHNIGFVDAGKYNNRIIVPVYLKNELRTWIARSIDLNISEEERVTTKIDGRVGLFGSQFGKPLHGPAIVSEGWADALHVERLRYNNSFALQTNAIHPEQIHFLSSFPYIIVIPDGDGGGDQLIDSCAEYFEQFEILIAKLPRKTDPASVDSKTLIKAIFESSIWKPSKFQVSFEIKF